MKNNKFNILIGAIFIFAIFIVSYMNGLRKTKYTRQLTKDFNCTQIITNDSIDRLGYNYLLITPKDTILLKVHFNGQYWKLKHSSSKDYETEYLNNNNIVKNYIKK